MPARLGQHIGGGREVIEGAADESHRSFRVLTSPRLFVVQAQPSECRHTLLGDTRHIAVPAHRADDSLDTGSMPPPPFGSDGIEGANTDDEMQLPPPGLPPISEDLPNAPEPPAPPPSFGGETDSPPTPPSPPLGKKLGLKLGGPSKKPSFKLGGKAGRIGKPTLNITRPPMPKPLPPTPDS